MLDVDVHCVDLDAAHPDAPGILSAEELARASQFAFDRDRRRYVNCRAALRRVLAGRLKTNPESIKFRYNPYGKPTLDGIHFNVSHSGRLAMIAISHARAAGIDVERMDARFASDQVPERFFSPREVRALRALPPAEQTRAFFGYWTRKEAYMKARGLGFALPSTSFDVADLPQDWSVRPIPAPAGYAAALCMAERRAKARKAELKLRAG